MFLFNINKVLLPIKAHYFLWNSGTAPITPFLTVYTKYLGFSSFVTGIIFTVLPIAGILGKPIVGWIADKFKCQKKMFSFAIVLTMVSFIAILYSPKSENNDDSCTFQEFEKYVGGLYEMGSEYNSSNCQVMCVYLTSNTNISYEDKEATVNTYFFTQSNFTPEATVKCVNAYEFGSMNKTYTICGKECSTQNFQTTKSKSVYADYPFWIYLILMMIAWLGQAIVVSTSDTICFEILGDKPNLYGKQRCFGSLGWGVFSVFAGMILDTGSEEEKNYTAAFYFGVAILALDFLASLSIKYEQKLSSSHIIRDVFQLMKNPKTVIFTILCVFMGMCTGLLWNFLFWLVEEISDNQDWVKTLEGTMMAIQCLVGELPLFFISGWILKRIGQINTMSLILFVLGFRFVLYSVIKNPWYLLPVEFLNGITFGLYYACMTSYASLVAPVGTSTTVQGSVGALFEVGVSLGSFLGGLFFEKYGGPMTFRIFGISAFIAGILHVLAQLLTKDKQVKIKDGAI